MVAVNDEAQSLSSDQSEIDLSTGYHRKHFTVMPRQVLNETFPAVIPFILLLEFLRLNLCHTKVQLYGISARWWYTKFCSNLSEHRRQRLGDTRPWKCFLFHPPYTMGIMSIAGVKYCPKEYFSLKSVHFYLPQSGD